MTSTSRRHQLGLSRFAAWLVAILLGVAGAGTYALWPTGDTNAPILQAPPSSALVVGTESGATTTFEWSHGFATLGNRNPRRASDFVVCVLESAGQQCAWPGTFPTGDSRLPLHVWTASAGALNRTPIGTTGMLEMFKALNPALDAPYRYSLTPPAAIPVSSFGRQLGWTAGACNGQTNARCRYAAVSPIRFNGLPNLEAVGVTRGLVVLTVDALALNSGMTDSGPFETTIRLWQVLLDSNNQVRIDINSSDFNDGTEVVLNDGSRRPRSQVPPGATVVGIILPGGTTVVEVDQHAGLPPAQQPGDELGVAQIVHTVPVSSRPFGYAVSFTLDPNYQLAETDETDNGHAEARVIL